MIRERALEVQQRGLRAWIEIFGRSSEGARLVELDGAAAAIVPATPERSICNSVVYETAAQLEGALDTLAATYAGAGIAAWSVWTPEFDAEAIGLLEAAGHAYDGATRAMSLDLHEFEPGELGDLDWDADADPALAGRLNDLAYGLPAESPMGPAIASPPARLRLYQARVGGEPVCVLGTIDHDRSMVGVYFVATDPDHRGKGLATRLMRAALGEARERGMELSSLQSSRMGKPIYAALGYSDDFAITLRERRS